ncbi:hypothetical protein KQY30_32920 [Streptomyces sp. GMY02]|uniref:hypothetical protein n=1 Tax=Streptomyces sp. GMY02 TaxID=1333528 RepID=UPI001C2C099D|nr:hypothetical protein [Streptomyces sp. GMY02]QXE38326.1 hypothetical protein KQY30_32920 [Streptomyces sp. GMY02]
MLNHLESKHMSSLNRIRQASGIEIVDEVQGEPGSSFSDLLPLNEFNEGWTDVTLDEQMLNEAIRIPGLAINWHTNEPLPDFFGEYRIPDPFEILMQPPDPAADSIPAGFKREFVRQLRYIDSAYRSGVGSMTYLRMKPRTSPLEIWHYDLARIGGGPYPIGYIKLDLTYHQYLETLVLTKGTRGWQYLFADVSFRDLALGDIGDSVKKMTDVFPRLFPEHDYTSLQRRLEERL